MTNEHDIGPRTGVPAHVRRVGIVGGGILGLATARRMLELQPGLDVTVVEKEDGLAQHQTGHNSGVVHAGIYYQPGSLKARLCVAGGRKLRSFCEEHAITYDECGKLIVATNDAERDRLTGLFQRGQENGVPKLRFVGPEELSEIEPHVTGLAGIHSPRTAVVDFSEVAGALARDVAAAGGAIEIGERVSRIDERQREVVVETSRSTYVFDLLVTCAGLNADQVARMSGDPTDPMIAPFRGQFLRLRPEYRDLVRGLIYPVPDPRYPFLGVHLTRTVHSEVLIGPNALLALAREGYHGLRIDLRELSEMLRWPGLWALGRQHWRTGFVELYRALVPTLFVRQARRYVPMLRRRHVVRGPSGVRAQALARDGSLVDDFVINTRGRVVNVRNAPSPAATSSLAIAEIIAGTALESV